MVFVHAHPDDESLATGATMALYAAQGAHVTLVTCTLGEQGEVIPAHLQHLEAGQDDALGRQRASELTEAMAALGVHDHRLLAGGRWRDSGMAWLEPGIAGGGAWMPGPGAFVAADLGEAAAALAEVLLEVRPQVVVTYDPRGGYGHPDHVKAHQITTAAVELTSDARAQGTGLAPAVYWIRVPRSWAEEERALLTSGGRTPPSMLPPPADAAYPPAVVDDAVVTAVVDGSAYLGHKRAALRAHATQVRVEGGCYALSNGEAHLLTGREAYQRVGAEAGHPWVADLFAVTQRHR